MEDLVSTRLYGIAMTCVFVFVYLNAMHCFHLFVLVWVCMYSCKYDVCMYICTYVCMYVCKHARTYVYVCMYV